MPTGKWKSKIGLEFQIRQPLPIMIRMAIALSQWVIRTASGWIGTGARPGSRAGAETVIYPPARLAEVQRIGTPGLPHRMRGNRRTRRDRPGALRTEPSP